MLPVGVITNNIINDNPLFNFNLQVFRAVDPGLVRQYNNVCGEVDAPRGKNHPNACRTKHIASQDQLMQMRAADNRL